MLCITNFQLLSTWNNTSKRDGIWERCMYNNRARSSASSKKTAVLLLLLVLFLTFLMPLTISFAAVVHYFFERQSSEVLTFTKHEPHYKFIYLITHTFFSSIRFTYYTKLSASSSWFLIAPSCSSCLYIYNPQLWLTIRPQVIYLHVNQSRALYPPTFPKNFPLKKKKKRLFICTWLLSRVRCLSADWSHHRSSGRHNMNTKSSSMC